MATNSKCGDMLVKVVTSSQPFSHGLTCWLCIFNWSITCHSHCTSRTTQIESLMQSISLRTIRGTSKFSQKTRLPYRKLLHLNGTTNWLHLRSQLCYLSHFSIFRGCMSSNCSSRLLTQEETSVWWSSSRPRTCLMSSYSLPPWPTWQSCCVTTDTEHSSQSLTKLQKLDNSSPNISNHPSTKMQFFGWLVRFFGEKHGSSSAS